MNLDCEINKALRLAKLIGQNVILYETDADYFHLPTSVHIDKPEEMTILAIVTPYGDIDKRKG